MSTWFTHCRTWPEALQLALVLAYIHRRRYAVHHSGSEWCVHEGGLT